MKSSIIRQKGKSSMHFKQFEIPNDYDETLAPTGISFANNRPLY